MSLVRSPAMTNLVRLLNRLDKHLVDPRTVHLDDLKTPVLPRELFGGLRYMVELVKRESGQCDEVALRPVTQAKKPHDV